VSIASIKAAVVEIVGDVAGIARAYPHAPNSLPPSDLPAAVVYTGESEYEDRGYQIRGESRTFQIMVYVAPMKQGIPGEVEARCEALFESVRAAFPSGARLERETDVLEARLVGDNGVSVMELGGSIYIGIQFNLRVRR
jgi:hypothetical protein